MKDYIFQLETKDGLKWIERYRAETYYEAYREIKDDFDGDMVEIEYLRTVQEVVH